jgi:two-component system, NarL family, sensor kinase
MDANPLRWNKHLKLRDVIEAIRLSDENFGAAGDVRGAALGVLSPDGRFILANNSAAAMFGYSAQDLIGKSLVEMAPHDDQQTILDGLSCSASGAFHSFGAVLCGPSGRKTAVLVHQQPIADTADRFTVFLTIFEERDVLPLGALEALSCAEPDSLRRCGNLMIGQERERKRVSSELHDGLGQALTLIKLMVEDSLLRIRRGSIDEATELLDTTVLRIREAIGEVRHICSELRPVLLDRLGFAAALEALCHRVKQGSGDVAVIFDCRVEEEEIPDRLKADMFRIAQEAMNNAMKHGAATEIRLTVRRVETGVVLAIQDNGIGFDNLPVWTDASSFSGLGLIGMQQRVESNGGSFFVQSGDGGGTLVSAMWKT